MHAYYYTNMSALAVLTSLTTFLVFSNKTSMNYVIMCARLVKLNRLRGLYPSFLKPASNITWQNPNKTGRSSANLLDVILYTVCMNVYQPFWQNCACLILLSPCRDKIFWSNRKILLAFFLALKIYRMCNSLDQIQHLLVWPKMTPD